MERNRAIDWREFRRKGRILFTKLIRTQNPASLEHGISESENNRLERCLTTLDLTSLGVGSCVGTGMYLVCGLVAHKYAGPAAALSFLIAAVASLLSGACYAEFGVRVPNTTGSAYTYSYVAVGEFIAFVIGWNMALEYLIGSSACARALSACLDSFFNGSLSKYFEDSIGTIYGTPPDVVAFAITLLMTLVLVAGVKKSVFFTHLLNAITLTVWVFTLGAGLFYMDSDNWTTTGGFLPFGWTGIFAGAATCFYAFIGFDIIATTGLEAQNAKRSIPLAIVLSLSIILMAYVSISVVLTLIVPYNELETDAALMQMFGHVHAPTCKFIVMIGAIAALTASMFGSMFPMPRILYAMAHDGLIYKQLGRISISTGTPAVACIVGGIASAFVSLFVKLEVLVEMMSIGTLLAYTLVSACVLVLRFQPHNDNLIDLLPQSLRHPDEEEGGLSGVMETTYRGVSSSGVMSSGRRVMVRRVTRSSPDSDDSLMDDDSMEFGRDDTFLISPNPENQFYVPGSCSGGQSRCSRFFDSLYRQLQTVSYLCPGLLPWVDHGPATDQSGLFVIKCVGALLILTLSFDLFAAYGDPSNCTFTAVVMLLLFLSICVTLLFISRKPQNRTDLMYAVPGLPFTAAIGVAINIYLILNLSILTLVRFTIWMSIGMFVYFKYGIHNSSLESSPPIAPPPTPQPRNPMNRTTIPPQPPESYYFGDRNIFEGDGNSFYGNSDPFTDPQLTWHDSNLELSSQSTSRGHNTAYKHVETRYDTRTNRTTSHTLSRPPWANPDKPYDAWDD